MPRDKLGNKLTWKEYMARWKKGIEGVTPFQQARITYQSTWITLLGLMLGLIVSLLGWGQLWWLFIILLGALGNTSIVQVANYQKLTILRRLELDE